MPCRVVLHRLSLARRKSSHPSAQVSAHAAMSRVRRSMPALIRSLRRALAAQRGACFLDLNMPALAIGSLTEATGLIESGAPGRVRDLAHYRIRIALAHLAAGSPGEAVD